MGTPFKKTLHFHDLWTLTKRSLPSSIVCCESIPLSSKNAQRQLDSNNSPAFAFNCKKIHGIRQSGYFPHGLIDNYSIC